MPVLAGVNVNDMATDANVLVLDVMNQQMLERVQRAEKKVDLSRGGSLAPLKVLGDYGERGLTAEGHA